MSKDIFREETILGYREGVVTTETLSDWNCHVCAVNDKVVFRYIEIFCESGNNYYVYEDTDGYDLFEKDFVNNRFTSYHEFWTTREPAVEERGSLSLKYYVRHGDDVYRFAPLEEAKKRLQEYEERPAKMTVLGHYATKETEEV